MGGLLAPKDREHFPSLNKDAFFLVPNVLAPAKELPSVCMCQSVSGGGTTETHTIYVLLDTFAWPPFLPFGTATFLPPHALATAAP